jgi:hypothetical protein
VEVPVLLAGAAWLSVPVVVEVPVVLVVPVELAGAAWLFMSVPVVVLEAGAAVAFGSVDVGAALLSVTAFGAWLPESGLAVVADGFVVCVDVELLVVPVVCANVKPTQSSSRRVKKANFRMRRSSFWDMGTSSSYV